MASLKEIRGRISSIKSTQQITRAMTMVAAAKLRRYQERITKMRPYAEKLQDILHHISGGMEDGSVNNPFYEKRTINRVLIVSLTGDRGLCGSFNNRAIKETTAVIRNKYPELQAKGAVDILSLGKKGTEYFKKHGYSLWRGYTDFLSNMEYEQAKELAEEVLNLYLDGEYDEIVLVYNKFKNPIVYFPTVEKMLPVEEEVEETKKEKPSPSGKATAKQEKGYNVDPQYIYEPSREEIMDTLIPKSLIVNFYRVMLDSMASEFGSRMTAMDQATDNAEDLIKDLSIKYNKARQATITKEIMEIVSGAQALENA